MINENQEKFFVHRDGQRIELEGSELESFLEQRAKDQIEAVKYQEELNVKSAAKESVKTKLTTLGLTELEISILIGETYNDTTSN